MKLKIVSDGTPRGTKIFDSDSGEELKNVTEIKINMSNMGIFADISLYGISVELNDIDIRFMEKEYSYRDNLP